MPVSWPSVGEVSLGVMALLVVGYVAVALVNRKKEKKDPLVEVIENNTEATRNLSTLVTTFKDFMVQTSTRQETKLDEILSHTRRNLGGRDG